MSTRNTQQYAKGHDRDHAMTDADLRKTRENVQGQQLDYHQEQYLQGQDKDLANLQSDDDMRRSADRSPYERISGFYQGLNYF